MTAQRKRIAHGKQAIVATEAALIVKSMSFTDAPAANIHGVNISMGATPFGPDETMIGRWYVVLLPPSLARDVALRNAWIGELNTITEANVHLESTEFVWGAGSFICAEQSTFFEKFAPKTSRNVQKDSELFVILVADQISGVIDDWDSACTISLFVS